MSGDNLITAVWSGTFRLFGVDVKCHTLSDGRRVIEGDSMAALLDAMHGGGAFPDSQTDEFTRWQAGAP